MSLKHGFKLSEFTQQLTTSLRPAAILRYDALPALPPPRRHQSPLAAAPPLESHGAISSFKPTSCHPRAHAWEGHFTRSPAVLPSQSAGIPIGGCASMWLLIWGECQGLPNAEECVADAGDHQQLAGGVACDGRVRRHNA